ncbi:hypothetical protein R50072_29650 [Simiduia litorea]|uniref:outer membrane protein assembly factor BamE n=1 Tax=Simiduia litorea TaxID=1435348 RepID=UPI0036F43DB5
MYSPNRSNRSLTLKASLLSVLLLLGGCGYFQFPGVYRIYVQQGNIVTDEMVNQLAAGMTKRQVRFVLGTPLIEDTFHAERWDYIWTLKDPRGDTRKQLFTVYFDGDTLARFEGDYKKGQVQEGTDAAPEVKPI